MPHPLPLHRLSCGLIALVSLACAPSPRPVPTPPHPVPTIPAPTPAHSDQRHFTYAPGVHRYIMTTDALLSLRSDSAPPLPGQIRTRALFTIALDSTGPLWGTVDSLEINPGPRVPPPPELPSLPLRWTSTAQESTDSCSLAQELVQLGKDIPPPLPNNLLDGYRWRDSTAHSLCRAGIPVTVSAVHQYIVDGTTVFESDSLVQLTRITTATLAGEHTLGGQVVTLAGTAASTARLYLDPGQGLLRTRLEEGRTEITIRAPRGDTHLTQEMRARLDRQP